MSWMAAMRPTKPHSKLQGSGAVLEYSRYIYNMIYVCLLKIDNQIETFFLTLANELTSAETKDGFG